ncbi:MAG: AAA family ATPase, partial [Acidimicrobiales bacterium]
EVSPFPFHGPLDPAEVTGRDELVAELTDRVMTHRVTALLGPRRYGKTSVLRRVAAECSELAVVWVDLYEVASMGDLSARLDQAVAAVAAPAFAGPARKVAASLSLNLGVLRVELRSPARERPDTTLAYTALLEVLVAAAARTPTLLVVDEFSFISKVPSAAGILRTALQHHYRDLGILVAGSQPSMMRTLFTERAEPFYGQADLVEITPLHLATTVSVVDDGFARTERTAGDLGGLIHRFTGGHPMRTMQLADAVWSATAPGATAGPEAFAEGLDALRSREEEPLERIFTRFGDTDKAALRAVAVSGSVWGAEAVLLGVAGGSAAKARQRLLGSGDLVRAGDRVEVTDPLMADWLRRRFPV